MFVAEFFRWNAVMNLRQRGIQVTSLHSWRRGWNAKKLNELYKAEYPTGLKITIWSFLNRMGWIFFAVGALIFVFGHK